MNKFKFAEDLGRVVGMPPMMLRTKVRHGACRPFTRVVALFTPEFQDDGKAT